MHGRRHADECNAEKEEQEETATAWLKSLDLQRLRTCVSRDRGHVSRTGQGPQACQEKPVIYQQEHIKKRQKLLGPNAWRNTRKVPVVEDSARVDHHGSAAHCLVALPICLRKKSKGLKDLLRVGALNIRRKS